MDSGRRGRGVGRRGLAVIAAGLLALGSAGIVNADGTIELGVAQQGLSWDSFTQDTVCGGFVPGDNEVVWDFVLTATSEITDATLTATFGGVTETNRPFDAQTASAMNWYVTTGPDTLIDAIVTYTGTASFSHLVVSHVCPGNMGGGGGGGGGAGVGDTAVGSNVSVTADGSPEGAPIGVTFDTVTVAGHTSVTISDSGPELPAGFQAGDPPTYWDLETTASYTGNVAVCFSYAGQSPAPTSLLHFEGDAWVDVTTSIDTDAQIICGTSTSLSPWVAVHVAPPSVSVPSDISAVASSRNGAVVTFSASATDHTGASVATTCVPASGSAFPIGTTSVTCSATDSNGTGSASFNVVVGYVFVGFASPVNDPITATNPMSVFKVGSTIAARFSLKYSTGKLVSDADAAAIAADCRAAVFISEGAAAGLIAGGASAAPSPICAHYDSKTHQFVDSLTTKGADPGSTVTLVAEVVAPDFSRANRHEVLIGFR